MEITIATIDIDKPSLKSNVIDNYLKHNHSYKNERKLYLFTLRVILILGLCVLLTSILTLIPRHNSMIYPQYWYEGMIAFVIGVCVPNAVNMTLDFYCLTGEKSLPVGSLFFKLLCSLTLIFTTSHVLCDIIWSLCSGYNRPIPFIGFTGFSLSPTSHLLNGITFIPSSSLSSH